jgi:hypothetical protein
MAKTKENQPFFIDKLSDFNYDSKCFLTVEFDVYQSKLDNRCHLRLSRTFSENKLYLHAMFFAVSASPPLQICEVC